uniref:Uncharacterized protein n=1 Tax=Oryza meridionalis TaxID=40149 RepID=A0A0E0C7J7_9ORYZ
MSGGHVAGERGLREAGSVGCGRRWKESSGLAAAAAARKDAVAAAPPSSWPPRTMVTSRPCATSSLPSSTVETRWPIIPGGG